MTTEKGSNSWLQEHLRTFVLPYIGDSSTAMQVLAPYIGENTTLEKAIPYFTAEEMAVIKNLWKSVKKASKGKMLVLPGRDVYIFEVLARRENFPTLFLPACSRLTVLYYKDKIPSNSFIFDTGFIGTIPRKLEVADFLLASRNRIGAIEADLIKHQVFPRLTLSRGLALKIERTPKYWHVGREATQDSDASGIYGGCISLPIRIRQDRTDSHNEFALAARLTIQIYTDSSPRFINTPKPLGLVSYNQFS